MSTATAQAPTLQTLFDINGTSLDSPAHNLQFSGITFTQTTWMEATNNGELNAQGGDCHLAADTQQQPVRRPTPGWCPRASSHVWAVDAPVNAHKAPRQGQDPEQGFTLIGDSMPRNPGCDATVRQDPGMARIETGVASGGGVVYDGRTAKIAGFGDGTVKLRFADGETLNVALTVFVLNARVSKEPDSPAPTTPWEPLGQRARHVRGMLNSYTRGRRAALHELGR